MSNYLSKWETSKDSYVLKSLSKIRHKSWELYVVSRILHILDGKIEFVCQQYVKPSKKQLIPGKDTRGYLTDLCFPSLGIYLEVNEEQHAESRHAEKDDIREKEIFEETNWEQVKIEIYHSEDSSIYKTLNEINIEIDAFIHKLLKKKKEIEQINGKELIWDYKSKFKPEKYIKEGSIHVKNNVSFLTQRDAKRLFGYKKGHAQNATWEVKKTGQVMWFPKLYPNADWDNELTKDGKSIFSKHKSGIKHKAGPLGPEEVIVFAHNKNALGDRVYKFVGVFEPICDGDLYMHSYKLKSKTYDISIFHKAN